MTIKTIIGDEAIAICKCSPNENSVYHASPIEVKNPKLNVIANITASAGATILTFSILCQFGGNVNDICMISHPKHPELCLRYRRIQRRGKAQRQHAARLRRRDDAVVP